jgi:hypothetical protein
MAGGGPIGNQKAKKLTTRELKQKAYKSYCDWIAQGKSQKSWCYESPELTLSYKCIETYMKNEPEEFPPIHKERAIAKGLSIWEDKGEEMMTSQARCQPAIYQMFMRNKFGWDKETPEEKVDREKRESRILESVYEDLEKRYHKDKS